jgi:deoxyribonuclease-1-like protein
MKKILLLFANVCITCILYAQITVCSWNLENFGKSKSDSVIKFIANTVKDFDVVALQEVVAGDGGAHAVAKLSDELNRKGFKWNYIISDPTQSSSHAASERYAFLWKTSRLVLTSEAWLEKKYEREIDREPFFATFTSNRKFFTLVNFHAITKTKQPETEIKYFKFLPLEYPDKNLVFCGDFNCPQSHTVFNPLKSIGYKAVFINQKTSLKEKYNGNNCLASEYDNVFYNASKIRYSKCGVIHFYKTFSTLKEARRVSDHVPIYFEFVLN